MKNLGKIILNLILIAVFLLAMFNIFKNFDKEEANTSPEVGIEILTEGEGEGAKAGDTLSVNYVGTFEGGEEFDSGTFDFILGNHSVIEGWEQGILGMKKGEKRKLFVPYELAYGEDGYASIPPKTDLYFEVELLDIK